MEGKATLTLTDAKTGRVVKELTEHNLVTDAVKRILAPPLYTIRFRLAYQTFVKNVMPISKLFSGIMLLGNTLEESKDNVMMNGSCIPVATAGDEYAGTDVRRGTLNSNETYATENGYHFTWDFGTDKANGVIKSIALTSRYMGNSAFKSSTSSGRLYTDPSNIDGSTESTTKFFHARGQYIGTFQERVHLYITYSGNTVTFLKYRSRDPHDIRINDTVDLNEWPEAESSTDVELPINLYYWYKGFLEPEKKVLYFFTRPYESGENMMLDYCGVNLNTFTVVEKGTQNVGSNKNARACAVYKGKFYMATASDIQLYSLGGSLLKTFTYSCHTSSWFTASGGMLSLLITPTITALFNDDNEIMTFYSPTWYLPTYSCDVKPPYYAMQYFEEKNTDSEKTSRNPALGLALNYLATINNLSTPLEKTSEHNLKITYDITN